jgi:hypothetical protein
MTWETPLTSRLDRGKSATCVGTWILWPLLLCTWKQVVLHVGIAMISAALANRGTTRCYHIAYSGVSPSSSIY